MTISSPTTKSKNVAAIYPLSPMQQGMLFHTLYSQESGIYFEQFICRISGNLNVEVFKKAWQQVVERHPVFRTLFVWENRKKPLQIVRNQIVLPWTESDWQLLSPSEQENQLEAFLVSDRSQGFKLDQAPLMRCALLRLTENSYEFVASFHHLLVDGWSLPIIFQEVFAFYEAGNKGESLYLATPRPYQDYINWLQRQDIVAAEKFWQQNLQGFTAPTSLGIDRTGHHQEGKFLDINFEFTTQTTTAFQNFAQQHHITLSTLIQGAWAILLSRYSGELDVLFGTTVSGRSPDLAGIESMVGLFINTLPVRVQIPEDRGIVTWLQDLQTQQAEREQYAYSPLVDIQGWSEVPRGISLFESLVVFENYPVDAALQEPLESLEIDHVRAFEITNYPLTLVAALRQKLSGKIIYDSDRFDIDTITRMVGHLQTLLTAIITNPNQPITKLPLLTETELQQVLLDWNNTHTDYPAHKSIHQIFEEQVEQTPDVVAVIGEWEQLTYVQLNNRANQVAHFLRKQGVDTGVPVGICMQRSLDFIVGILGILKAGGVYVPLDPEYPQARLTWMLEDVQPQVVLTQADLIDKLPRLTNILFIDTAAIQQESTKNLILEATADNLAYIMYTSGSTGKPKGVSIPHRGVVRLVKATDYITFSSEAVWLQLAPISFDAATLEIWGSLLNGSKLVIMPIPKPSLEEIGQIIQKQQITTLWLTASLFHLIVDERLEDLKSVRQLLAGGDVLSVTHVQKFLQYLPQCRLVNGYGPTENTTFTCCFPMNGETQLGSSVPIGRPIANTQVYILDPNLQPVPVGVWGELYTGGAGLAQGYWKRPDLTQEKFIQLMMGYETPKIASTLLSESLTLYKTGDLVRYLLDGNIEFFGRIDHQVKVRGFRIELGEIEAKLATHPQIKQSVIITQEDNLIAYFLPEAEAPTGSELRHYLKQQLPEYMLPVAYICLDKFPLTTNGKVDRKALPTADLIKYQSVEYIAPRNAQEQAISQIISSVLNLEKVGIDHNFFEIGGNSLNATQVVLSIHQTFGVKLPLRSLLESPTVKEIAVSIEQILATIQKIQSTPVDLSTDREEIEL